MLKYNYVTNYKMTIFNNNYYYNFNTIGDWGLGIGDWGLGQSPIPNPQSPIVIYLSLNY